MGLHLPELKKKTDKDRLFNEKPESKKWGF